MTVDCKYGSDKTVQPALTAAALPNAAAYQISEANKKLINALVSDATSKIVTSIGTAIKNAAGTSNNLSIGSKIKCGTVPSPLKQKAMANHSVSFSKILGMNLAYNKSLNIALIKMSEEPLIDIAIEWIAARANETEVRAFVQSHVMPKASDLCSKVTTVDKEAFKDAKFWITDVTNVKVAQLFAVCKIDFKQ